MRAAAQRQRTMRAWHTSMHSSGLCIAVDVNAKVSVVDGFFFCFLLIIGIEKKVVQMHFFILFLLGKVLDLKH